MSLFQKAKDLLFTRRNSNNRGFEEYALTVQTASVLAINASNDLYCYPINNLLRAGISASYARSASWAPNTGGGTSYPDISDDGSGHVGINQPSAYYNLDVNTAIISTPSSIGNRNGNLIIDTGAAGTPNATSIQPRGGFVGVGTLFPNHELDVHGIINTDSGYYYQGSPWSPNVVAESTGSGTCLVLQASDNGATMYIHVNSSGVISASLSP